MLKRFLIVLLAWTAGPVPADVIIDIVNEGTTRWLCVEVVDGEDVVISRHTAQSKAEACMLTQQLIHPDRVFRAVGQERLKVIVSPEAQALLVKYSLEINGPGSIVGEILTTAYPSGNAPLDSPGASCGPQFECSIALGGEIDEVSTTRATISANTVNTNEPDYLYQELPDSGDIQARASIPSTFGGSGGTFRGVGPYIRETATAGSWAGRCWRANNAMRFSYGTTSPDTLIGTAGGCSSGCEAVIQADASATTMSCSYSEDAGSTWVTLGPITRDLACAAGTCRAGVMASSASDSQTSTFDVQNIAIGSTLTALTPEDPPAEPNPENLIWSGDGETADTLQWPNGSDFGYPFYWGMPTYCRPARFASETNDLTSSYYGDGSCLELVTSPVRQGTYAFKFTVKNSANGTDSSAATGGDWDGSVETRRRSELWFHKGMPEHYGGMAYGNEVWLSASYHIPADWSNSGSGFGPLVFQIKPYNEPGSSGLSPTFGIELKGDYWKIIHRWSPTAGMTMQDMKWQWGMIYTGRENGECYPRASGPSPLWADGVAHFPNEAASCAALQSVNKGGWTDFVWHMKFDAAGEAACGPAGCGTQPGASPAGTGLLELWMREDSGSWVKILDITPGWTTRGGEVFNHGVGYNSPSTGGSNPGGFGPIMGLYMDKRRVWDLPANRVIVIDNVKVGDANATFSDMSPDGSTP